MSLKDDGLLLSREDAAWLGKVIRWFRTTGGHTPTVQRFPRGGGGAVKLAKTQEAAPASNKIKVKLVDSSGNETGEEFYAYGMFVDGATMFTEVTPVIQSGKFVSVFLSQYGAWILNMTLTHVGDECEE